MSFYDKWMKVVKLYVQYDFGAAKGIHELGYPKSRRTTLKSWYKEYKETNDLHPKRTRKEKFSEEQKRNPGVSLMKLTNRKKAL